MDAMSKSLDFLLVVILAKIGQNSKFRAEKREGEKVQSSPVGKLISSFFHFEHPHALLYIAGPAGMQSKHKDPSFDNAWSSEILIIIDFFEGGTGCRDRRSTQLLFAGTGSLSATKLHFVIDPRSKLLISNTHPFVAFLPNTTHQTNQRLTRSAVCLPAPVPPI